MKLTCELNEETLQNCINLFTGVYYPLKGFLGSSDYRSVVDTMKLSDGSVWSIPFTLDVSRQQFDQARDSDRLFLMYQGMEAGFLTIEDCFEVNPVEDVVKVYKTGEAGHPVVEKELGRSVYRIGGNVTVTEESLLEHVLRPEKTRDIFSRNGWRTVVAFHTRNPVHRAHEHLQRTGLEYCDGLFINPFLGWKKPGDFSDEAIMNAYRAMVDAYYPPDRVYLEGMKAAMNYAGPREAIFHALIRRNLGCTHIIIGRDHAGVGSYYGRYEAQELAVSLSQQENLGIEILPFKEPYFCTKCGQITSETNCRHGEESIIFISGTGIREMLRAGERPDERYMRPEVVDALLGMKEKMFMEGCV